MTRQWPVGDSPRRVFCGELGLHLECQAWGPTPSSEHATLVLLHEGLGSVGLWRAFPERLSARTGLGVLAWSRPGHGFSDARPTDWTPDYLSQDADQSVAPVLDTFGIERAVLLGHSDGGSIAAGYAGHASGQADSRLIGLVLMAPHFFTEPQQLDAIRNTGKRFYATDLRERMARHHQDIDSLFAGWHDAWVSAEFAVGELQVRLPDIRVPVFAVQGVEDEYGSSQQLEALVACPQHRGSRLLAQCGHSPHLEQTEQTLTEISRFLAAL